MFGSITEWICKLDVSYSQSTSCKDTKIDFTHVVPTEIAYRIFSHLNETADLVRCQRVNRKWQMLISHETLWNANILKKAFGKEQWATYFGDIGQEEPPIPKDIHKILNSPCPFWLGKKVEETHMLFLVPKTIDGKLLNLEKLGELVKAPKKGQATQYRCILDASIKESDNQATAESRWVLMTKKIIKESENKNYREQKIFIAKFVEQTGINYEVPDVLDASVGIFVHSIRFGERLFNKDSDLSTYTRVKQNTHDRKLVIGGFSADGLFICYNGVSHSDVGVAALRRLF